ncbi:MAG: hypothetical protein RLZZ308_607 [Candidatus Parcubacteria bacterium]|jgi:hypothetical protein
MKQDLSQSIKKEWLISKYTKGFLLVEIILATALFVIFLTAFTGAYVYGEKAIVSAGDRAHALFFAESGMEAVRSIRNDDFLNLNDGQFGLSLTNGVWTFSGTHDVLDRFTRTTEVSSIDKDRKNVTTTVSWKNLSQSTSTVTLTRSFTNWLDLRYWYWPGLVQTLDLPAGGHKVQVQGNYAYVIGAVSPVLYVVDVTSSTSPQIVGSMNLVGNLQNLAVQDNYAYVVSDDNTRELQVINITNKTTPSLQSFYNAPSSADAMGIYVTGTKAYMTRQNSGQDEFAVLDINNPNNVALLGSLNLGATGFEVVASGTYAYLASDNNVEELQIIDVSNSSNPFMKGTLNLSLKEQNRSSAVSLNNTLLYLGQGKDLYIIDVASTTNPVQKNNTSVADYFNDVSTDLGNKKRFLFVATSDVNKEFKVYNVSSSTYPVVYGSSLDLSGDSSLYGIAYATSTNIVYAVTHNTTNSFFIIAP